MTARHTGPPGDDAAGPQDAHPGTGRSVEATAKQHDRVRVPIPVPSWRGAAAPPPLSQPTPGPSSRAPNANASYAAVHQRLKCLRGPASDYPCSRCGKRARDWAYDHLDPDEKMGDKGPYSTDLARYAPLCKQCHCCVDNSQHAAEGRRRRGQLRVRCCGCGGELRAVRSTAVFCSAACRARRWRNRRPA